MTSKSLIWSFIQPFIWPDTGDSFLSILKYYILKSITGFSYSISVSVELRKIIILRHAAPRLAAPVSVRAFALCQHRKIQRLLNVNTLNIQRRLLIVARHASSSGFACLAAFCRSIHKYRSEGSLALTFTEPKRKLTLMQAWCSLPYLFPTDTCVKSVVIVLSHASPRLAAPVSVRAFALCFVKNTTPR